MIEGPDLPKPLAGHCQVFTTKGQVVIYGGITAITHNKSINGEVQYYQYSNEAYIWSHKSWQMVPNKNPCPIKGQDLAFQQPCASRKRLTEDEVVIITFRNGNPCTSILNLNSHAWAMVDSPDFNIPIGGHLVTSLDNYGIFYLGGLYSEPQLTQSLDVYELKSDGWQLIEAKLPYGISSNETKSYPSLHNVTLN